MILFVFADVVVTMMRDVFSETFEELLKKHGGYQENGN